MRTPSVDPACIDLAEQVLEAELRRAGIAVATSARVLSLAAAIQDAIETWYTEEAEAADRPDPHAP